MIPKSGKPVFGRDHARLRGSGHERVCEFVPKYSSKDSSGVMTRRIQTGSRRLRAHRSGAAAGGEPRRLHQPVRQGRHAARRAAPTGSITRASISSTTRKIRRRRSKKFEEVDRQHPYSEWARKSLIMSSYAYYEAGSYDDSVTAAKRYISLHPGSPDAAYAQFLIGSCLFRRNPGHHPRPGAHRQGAGRARRSGAEISDQRIRRQRQAEDRGRARPARRQGNGWSAAIIWKRRTTPAPSTASKSSSPSTRPRVTSKRR